MITFMYGTLHADQECYGGIEHFNCSNPAVWTELDHGDYRGVVCDRCKVELETYINNHPIINPEATYIRKQDWRQVPEGDL